jgi:hypothetical protein
VDTPLDLGPAVSMDRTYRPSLPMPAGTGSDGNNPGEWTEPKRIMVHCLEVLSTRIQSFTAVAGTVWIRLPANLHAPGVHQDNDGWGMEGSVRSQHKTLRTWMKSYSLWHLPAIIACLVS